MNGYFRSIFFVLLGLSLISGCAIAPVKQEIELPDQDLMKPLTDKGKVRLVMYNNSNKLWFGVDGSGNVNITLNGKGVCRLGIGEFVIVDTFPGEHKFDLEHKDMAIFKSSYTISIDKELTFMQVFATPASNVAEITDKPEQFERDYRPIK